MVREFPKEDFIKGSAIPRLMKAQLNLTQPGSSSQELLRKFQDDVGIELSEESLKELSVTDPKKLENHLREVRELMGEELSLENSGRTSIP